ncbi:MAG: amino acid ABC transporter permease [Vampirovibrionia bacterium]
MFPAFLDFQILIDSQYLPLFIKGLKTTLLLCVLGNFISIIIGILIGLAKLSPIKPLKYFASAYVEVFRNTPLLVQVYFFFFGLGLEPFWAGLSGLCTYTSAYMAEVIRAGIQSVPEIEIKAGEALGLNTYDRISKVILPQAFRIIIPPMSNQLMNLTKNTSIVYFITVADVTYIFETLSAQTFKFFEFFIVAALTYMIICWIIALISYFAERYYYVPGMNNLEVGLDH